MTSHNKEGMKPDEYKAMRNARRMKKKFREKRKK
jgi:hypothetical protein